MYAIGFAVILTPVLFVAELHASLQTQTLRTISKWVAVITLFYFWATITRLDPNGFQGLTQRIAVIIMFGWFSYASYALSRSKVRDGAMPSATFSAAG